MAVYILTILLPLGDKVISNRLKNKARIEDFLDNAKQSELYCKVGIIKPGIYDIAKTKVTHLGAKKVVSAYMVAASASEALWKNNYP